MATEVEIMGHKAKIEMVSGEVAEKPFRKEEQLVVWISFDKAVGSILSFPVCLPVKKYERDEFLYNVRRRGEEALKRILARDESRDRELEDKRQRQAAVDAVAAEVQNLIE